MAAIGTVLLDTVEFLLDTLDNLFQRRTNHDPLHWSDTVLLTDEERRKFAAYLRQDAESNKLLSEAAKKMGSTPMMIIARRKRLEADAESMVARMLEETESVTLSKGDPP